MNLAVITQGFPYPLTSGRLRQYHLLKHLRQHLSTKLICASDQPPDEETRAALTEIVDEFVHIATTLQDHNRKAVDSAKQQLHDELTAECRAFEADAVLNAGRLPLACLPGDDRPMIVDFCDAEWLKVLELAKLAPLPQSLRMRVRAIRTRRYERRLAQRADHALFAAERDAGYVLQGLSTPHTVIPNGIDLDFWSRQRESLGQATVLYAGAFSYRPNIDAALFLANEIIPKIRKSCPEARLILAGRDPPPELQALASGSNVEVTGFVEDIRPYYEKATVFLAPLRVAGGIQNKLLEAMALEIPVVTTNKGVAGLGLSTEEGTNANLHVCDSAEDLANATLAVLRSQAKTPELASENRRLVTDRFSWTTAASQLAEIATKLIAARQSTSVGATS